MDMKPDIRELIRLAFWAARDRGKADWWRMTTPVLKNRLLTLTDRQFNEEDYGARSLTEFATRFPDLIALDSTTYPPEVELRPIRIRPDLWRAAIDYRSGLLYVWDGVQKKARERTAADPSEMLLPTLRMEDVSRWRAEFAERNRSVLTTSETETLRSWVELGLATQKLPERLVSLWNREQSWRVWEHLTAWFMQRVPEEERPTLSDAPEPSSRGFRARLVGMIKRPRVEAAASESDALRQCRDAGDWLAVGELLIATSSTALAAQVDAIFAKVVAAWAAPVRTVNVGSIYEFIAHLDEVAPEQAARAVINASYRIRKSAGEIPQATSDLVFRLTDTITSVYGVSKQRSPHQLCLAAVAKLASANEQLVAAVKAFEMTSAVTAKPASIELLRRIHQYRPFALAGETAYLRELDIVLGVVFRKFCENCERHQAGEARRRAEELRVQTDRLTVGVSDTRTFSTIWTSVVRPVVSHVADLLEEGTRQSEEVSRPNLALEKGALKVDLTTCERPTTVSCRLVNDGHGRALRIDVAADISALPAELELVEPARPFEVAGSSSQILTFSLVIHESLEHLTVPITWICSDSTDRRIESADQLQFEQQGKQPDWDALLLQPPYTVSPVREKDRLFGRDAILTRLILHATSGTSTFVWGQKRVGKTSLLQVLAGELEKSGRVSCIFLRMGELIALHEGQIAHTIALRLNERSGAGLEVPAEDSFGAGLSRLIPIVEEILRARGGKLVVIIDEFDDLDPAFYTGERGRQFVKALRSLSEVGLTFFFVGSERMDTIYSRHAVELNKWVNVSLDRIESFVDCRELIVEPVQGELEYEDSATAFIIEYCGGNPFYMQLFCFEAFKRCVEDHRTYISSADVQVVRQHLLKTLGRTNFAHFWDDNPELGQKELLVQGAENCLVLAAIASLGGRYESVEDVHEAQDALGLADSALMTLGIMRQTVDRLRRRHVLTLGTRDGQIEVALPIFREWLAENSHELLQTWRDTVGKRAEADKSSVSTAAVVSPAAGAGPFPIGEDDLLAVSQRLVYCGRQKDVAEVRQWLRQFDDDTRIEVAFILLKRLAEQGYMSEGARGRTLSMVEEALQHRRTEIGNKTWKIVRGRKDNLCITYVDSETKSGAATARELAKRVRPGKVADGEGIAGWLRSHRADDPLVLIVDDFSGTGATLEKGMKELLARFPKPLVEEYMTEGRLSCYCLFAFPEAIDRLRELYPRVDFFAAHFFGDEVRALDADSRLFESEDDRTYARDILLQIGRELNAQMPLGWCDMAALVAFHNTIPNNSLPVFWCEGRVNERLWQPLFPRA